MVRQSDSGLWCFPGGKLKTGETAEQAAWREFHEECGYRLGSVGKLLMRRVHDDGAGVVDYSTFLAPVESNLLPFSTTKAHLTLGWTPMRRSPKTAPTAWP